VTVARIRQARSARAAPGIHGSSSAVSAPTSLQRSEPSNAASIVPSRPNAASCSASDAKNSAPTSWKWLGHASSMRADSTSSGKLAATAAHGAGHDRRSARWTSTAPAASSPACSAATTHGHASIAGPSTVKYACRPSGRQ
jgi:hypothetical protein